MTPEVKPVVQADREAAWPLAPECFKNDPNPGAHDRWMSGLYDNHRVIQAFARHRLTARTEALREVVAWLRSRPSNTHGEGQHITEFWAGCYADQIDRMAEDSGA